MDRLNQLLKLKENKPEDSFILFALAKEYEKLGCEAESRSFFEQIVKTNPNYLAVYYHFAKNLINNQNIDKAIPLIQQGIEVAKARQDFKSLSELNTLLSNISIEEDEY